MAKLDNILRSFNNWVKGYADLFGVESPQYQEVVSRVESDLPPQVIRRKANGEISLSRSKANTEIYANFDLDDLMQYRAVKGTAKSAAKKYIGVKQSEKLTEQDKEKILQKAHAAYEKDNRTDMYYIAGRTVFKGENKESMESKIYSAKWRRVGSMSKDDPKKLEEYIKLFDELEEKAKSNPKLAQMMERVEKYQEQRGYKTIEDYRNELAARKLEL